MWFLLCFIFMNVLYVFVNKNSNKNKNLVKINLRIFHRYAEYLSVSVGSDPKESTAFFSSVLMSVITVSQ